ncbi:MAG: SAM-dependent chlorinase/fluorinase [Actinomycetota bacterium]|nr:SAM-dependent chlorinase/fluorinase [Actinomycetota bacterium]
MSRHPGPPARYAAVTFLSDFGLDDIFVGVCHGVLARFAADARVIDMTHAVPRGDVATGAVLLARATTYLPVSVHLAVVDPGVGTERRGVAVVADRGDVLVGPDNGLLVPAARALGGVIAAFELADPQARLQPVSDTFHGRDVFAPAAGLIAAGHDPRTLGPAVTDLTDVPTVPAAAVAGGRLHASVTLVDRFGNLQLAASPADLASLGSELGDEVFVDHGDRSWSARWARTFGDVAAGDMLVHQDSDRALAVAVNGGSAAARTGAARGDVLTLAPASTTPHGGGETHRGDDERGS